MSEQKTDPGLGAPTIPDAPPSTEPTLPEDRVGMARYTTDPRVVVSPEREVLRGLRAEPTPLTGLRDLVQDVHDLQEAKKLREAAIEQAKVEHAAEAPTVPRPRGRSADTPRMQPPPKVVVVDEPPPVERSSSRLDVTSPGERARTRVGTRQLLGVAALCALVGVVFVYVITRGGSGTSSGTTATSASATASATVATPTTSAASATTLSSGAPVPSVGTADTTATSVVAPPPSPSETPSAKHAAPTKTGPASTAITGTPNSTNTAAPTLTAATAPTTTSTPATPVSVAPGPTASAPNIWKIKEH